MIATAEITPAMRAQWEAVAAMKRDGFQAKWDGVCCSVTDGFNRTHGYVNEQVAWEQAIAGQIYPPNFFTRPHEHKYTSMRPAPATCRSCNASIIWTRTEQGARVPLDVTTTRVWDGQRYALSHFLSCPQASEWSSKPKSKSKKKKEA